jgi:methylmalonyl-CoA/ethylmalonyl-CoA epimerase
MKIKRIEHIAIAVKNMAPLKELLEGKLGIQMEYEENLPQYNTKLQMYPVGQTYLELLESDKPDTATNKWIAERGEGLFHICLEVEDIDAAMVELRAKGVAFQSEAPMAGHGNSRIVFLDPKSTGGLVIELAQLPEGGHGDGHGHGGHKAAAE